MTRSEKFKTAIDYYQSIEKFDNELTDQCEKEIEPLMNSAKYDEAYDYVREFFKEGRITNGDFNMFLGHDTLLAKIIRLRKSNS